MSEEITDDQIRKALMIDNWQISTQEGRLMLLELLVKANAGYRSSHTEENFLHQFGLLNTKSRTSNKKGRRFICEMVYMHSNKKPKMYELATVFRD